MKPYNQEIDPREYSFDSDTTKAEIWINIYTALDQESISKPDRIVRFLIDGAKSRDREERRLATLILGEYLITPFGLKSLPEAKQTLMKGLYDRDATVRKAAVISWGNLAMMPYRYASSKNAWCFFNKSLDCGRNNYEKEAEAQLVAASKPAVSKLIDLTSRDPNEDVRSVSILALNSLELLNLIDSERLLSIAQLILLGGKSPTEKYIALRVFDEHTTKRPTLPSSLLKDADPSIVMLSAKILGRNDMTRLVGALENSNKNTPTLLASQQHEFPSSYILRTERGIHRLYEIFKTGSLHARINAANIFVDNAEFKDDFVAEGNLLDLYKKGVDSRDPILQLDALRGIQELRSNYRYKNIIPANKLANAAAKGMDSNYEEVRQMAALVTIGNRPLDKRALHILAEILKNSSDDNLRSQAIDSLLGAKSPEASQVIAETAWSQSTKDLYLRSCSYGGVPLSLSAEHSIALKSLTDPRCRRALADSVTFENEDADLSILDNLGLSTDPDVRFNVAYSIGQDLESSATDNEMRLRPKARERLLRIANNNEELPEIRRIAATQLHLHAVPMHGLFKALNLPLPTSCHNPGKPGARGGVEGFVFDPYEGRCMYDSRTGCGDGLPEIYTKLRSRLAKGKQWYQWLAFF